MISVAVSMVRVRVVAVAVGPRLVVVAVSVVSVTVVVNSVDRWFLDDGDRFNLNGGGFVGEVVRGGVDLSEEAEVAVREPELRDGGDLYDEVRRRVELVPRPQFPDPLL